MPAEISLSQRLRELAMNLFWAWQPEVADLFRQLDAELWDKTNHNPVAFLKAMPQAEIDKRSSDAYLSTRILHAHQRLQDYLSSDGPLGGIAAGPLNAAPVAYFSAEFGIHECLPIYSGGLGILAGDHLKGASNLGVPLVGVGLLYHQGYTNQVLDPQFWQQDVLEPYELKTLPLDLVREPD